MRSRLVIASAATDAPMGAQVYQEEVAGRAAAALREVGSALRVERTVVRSLRSPLAGTLRLPMGWIVNASPRERALVGRFLYGCDAVVHRMNLELPPGAGPQVATLHDVVAWRFPDEAAPVRAAGEELRRADAVICVSQFSADEAAHLLGLRNLTVVRNGVHERFFDAAPLPEPRLAEVGVRGRYVFAGGGVSARKNLAGLAEAWRIVSATDPDLSLVLAGPPHPMRAALFAGLPRVVAVGRVPDAVLPGLMAAASVVVVPSLYEGFGLPAIEAMAVGAPLVAARTSSLPEVVGDAGLLVEPTGAGLAEGILDAAAGGPAVADMVAHGRRRAAEYTWERSALGHARVWASLA